MEFPLNKMWNFHMVWHYYKTGSFHEMRLWIWTHEISYCLHGYVDQLICFA